MTSRAKPRWWKKPRVGPYRHDRDLTGFIAIRWRARFCTVTAEIGGHPATVLYAGNVMDIVSGVTQVNLMAPKGLAAGSQPVTITVGLQNAQTGVTVAVQ
jgi:uncharacterized protein (TIGR03437 family)